MSVNATWKDQIGITIYFVWEQRNSSQWEVQKENTWKRVGRGTIRS